MVNKYIETVGVTTAKKANGQKAYSIHEFQIYDF